MKSTRTVPRVRTSTDTLDPVLGVRYRVPAVPPDAVVRRRLLDLLRGGAASRLTLLSAPAGYGKTVLVSSWLADEMVPGTVAYLALEDGDESPTAFWGGALGAFGLAGLEVAGLHAEHGAGGPLLTALAQRVAAHGEPVVWVLDCAEHAMSPAVGTGVHRLLDACGGRVRLVLSTRSDPPLALHRYRLEGTVTEIRAADLAFNTTESSTVLQRAGVGLAPAEVAALQDRTGGWPAGLRFAAMALCGHGDTGQAIADFRGDTGNVAAYLMTEVLDRQPPEMRQFLLRTCIVDELEPGLVAVLTDRHCDDRALRFMTHGSSFVEPVPGGRARYRYQSLFREFLRSQLAFEEPDLAAHLHRTAAEWYAQHGRPLTAVRQAVQARDWATAARYLVNDVGVGAILVGHRRTALRALFAELPADAPGPESAVTRAALAVADLDTDRCASELDTARALLADEAEPGTPACHVAARVLEALDASLGADPEAGLAATLAAESALHQNRHADGTPDLRLRTVVAGCSGRVLLMAGDLTAAAAALADGMAAARAAGRLEPTATELRGMAALVEAVRGRLRKATELATHGAAAPDEAPAVSEAAALALAWVRLDEGAPAGAEELLRRAEGLTPSYDARLLDAVRSVLLARLAAARGEHEVARATLASVPRAGGMGWLDRLVVRGQAASWLAEGRPGEARAAMGEHLDCSHVSCRTMRHRILLACGTEPPRLSEPASGPVPLAAVVDRWLALAHDALREHDHEAAERSVEQALRLAAPERLRRPFAEAPDDVRALLEENGGARSHWLRMDPDHTGPLHDDHTGTAVNAGRDGAAMVNPLTTKEQEVLGYLADLLTTEEIAETMFVSVNTVRSHVRSILRKLGATRRNEAVRRAWELRLLPPRSAA